MYTPEQHSFEYFSAPDINALSEAHKKLVLKAREASWQAYAPYSRFKVGAAILLEDGTFVQASNTENAAFPACICAERSALVQSRDRFPDLKIISLSVTANPVDFNLNKPATPCGTCRQVMAEFERQQGQDYEVVLSGQSGQILILKSARMLLPLDFHLDELKR